MTGLAVGLAVAGACCYAVAAWLQQAAVHVATGGGGLRLAGWARMVCAPRWVSGLGLATAGAGLHAGALSMAPLVVVQPVGALAIALTTVLATRSAGGRLTRSAGGRLTRSVALAVAGCVLGVSLFVALAAGSPAPAAVPAGVETRAGVLAGLIAAALGILGLLAHGWTRCLAFAAAAAVAYGLTSVLVHTTAARVEADGVGQLRLASVTGVAAALLVGGWFTQHAYAAGPPQVVVASQTVIDPMLGVGIGIGLLGEGAEVGTWTAAGLGLGAVLAITGVIVLARHHTAAHTDTRPVAARRWPTPTAPADTVPADGRALRIVIGADTFPPDINGASHFAERLARGLAERGHEVHVLCPATQARSTAEVTGGVVVHRVASRRTPLHPTFRVCPPWQAFRAASALLDELAADVVHVQAHFLLGRALVHAASRRGVAVVATNHFMPENLFEPPRVRWRLPTLRR